MTVTTNNYVYTLEFNLVPYAFDNVVVMVMYRGQPVATSQKKWDELKTIECFRFPEWTPFLILWKKKKISHPFFPLVRPRVKTRDFILSKNTDLIFDLLQRAALAWLTKAYCQRRYVWPHDDVSINTVVVQTILWLSPAQTKILFSLHTRYSRRFLFKEHWESSEKIKLTFFFLSFFFGTFELSGS